MSRVSQMLALLFSVSCRCLLHHTDMFCVPCSYLGETHIWYHWEKAKEIMTKLALTILMWVAVLFLVKSSFVFPSVHRFGIISTRVESGFVLASCINVDTFCF